MLTVSAILSVVCEDNFSPQRYKQRRWIPLVVNITARLREHN